MAVLASAGFPLSENTLVLDLGTGSGEIADNLSQTAKVIACDITDQRTQDGALTFVLCNDTLPFANATFDVVVTNHVIEHVASPALHLREIHRVLKPGGAAYLATPNRLWPREFHTGLWLLHYLPAHLFRTICKAGGHLDEFLWLQTTWTLAQQANHFFRVDYWHHRLLRTPDVFSIQLPRWASVLVRILPDPVLRATLSLHPTLICLLRPR